VGKREDHRTLSGKSGSEKRGKTKKRGLPLYTILQGRRGAERTREVRDLTRAKKRRIQQRGKVKGGGRHLADRPGGVKRKGKSGSSRGSRAETAGKYLYFFSERKGGVREKNRFIMKLLTGKKRRRRKRTIRGGSSGKRLASHLPPEPKKLSDCSDNSPNILNGKSGWDGPRKGISAINF